MWALKKLLNAYVNAGPSFFALLPLLPFFFLLSTGTSHYTRIRHVQLIVLKGSTALSHCSTGEGCHELRQWIWLAFFFLFFCLFQLCFLECRLIIRWIRISLAFSTQSFVYSQEAMIPDSAENLLWDVLSWFLGPRFHPRATFLGMFLGISL